MKKGLEFAKSILEIISREIPNDKIKPNITIGPSGVLKYSFFAAEQWYAFELTETDLKKDPETIIKEVKKDLHL